MSDTVSVTMPVKFVAWKTPTEAHIAMPPRPRQEGIRPLPAIALEDLAPDVLDALAWQWLTHLYAGVKRRPPFYQSEKDGGAR